MLMFFVDYVIMQWKLSETCHVVHSMRDKIQDEST